MSKYELTVDMNYVADWGLSQAIRELFQNAFDAQKEDSKNIAFCNYYPERETIEIGNKSSVLNIETLLLGATSKADDSNTIGQFGEGYKLATLVLLRLGKEVTFYNYGCREVWHTKLVKSRRYNGHFVPVFDVDKKFIWQSVPHNNLIIEVKGISPEEYETIKKFVLPLNEDMGDTLDCMHLGKILLNEKYKGDVYCSGLYICHNDELQYGYDIEPRFLELERDRQTVTNFNLTWITSRMWSLHSDTAQFRELLFGNNTFDLSYIHTNLTANDELMEALRNNYGDIIPVLTQEEYDAVKRLGGNPRIVSSAVRKLYDSVYTNYINTKGKAKESCYDKLNKWFDKLTEQFNIGDELTDEFVDILDRYEDILK